MVRGGVRALLSAVGLGLPFALSGASSLEDLRATLEKLRAREFTRVGISQETSGQFTDEGELRTRQGRARILVEDGGAGQSLHLVYDDGLLVEAGRERGGRRNAAGPGDAIRDLSALRVVELVRTADKLLEDLKGAEILQEGVEERQGEMARTLDLKLPPPASTEREKGFKITRRARIWLNAVGIPVASEIRTHTEIRRLIFKVRFDTTDRSDYAVSGHRLFTKRRETENRWKAWILSEGSNRSVTIVEPL